MDAPMTDGSDMTAAPRKLSAAEVLQPDAAGAAVRAIIDDRASDTPAQTALGNEEEMAGGDAGSTAGQEAARDEAPDPTRYGDWEKKGRCVDF